MATVLAPPISPMLSTRPRLTTRQDLIAVLLGLWMMAGAGADALAHATGDGPDSFFTLAHGILYSGFLASAAWMVRLVARGRPEAHGIRAAVPVGYGLGAVGVLVFGFGGFGDLTWHSIFGIENDIEALVSPTHLLLSVGAMLLITSPLRSAWSSSMSRRPAWAAFLPAQISITLAAVLIALLHSVLSPFVIQGATLSSSEVEQELLRAGVGSDLSHDVRHFVDNAGLGGILLTSLLVVGVMLFLLRRWTPPFGAFTILVTAVAGVSLSVGEFEFAAIAPSALVAGLVIDLLVARLQPSPSRLREIRVFAAAAPLIVWSGYFLALALAYDLRWSVELWAGVTLLTGMGGVALSLIAFPPSTPGMNDSPIGLPEEKRLNPPERRPSARACR